ncbi:hypothetical protein ABTY98_05230 [Streptomyces sp. NPDC096040]|uniref:hypothetical protein n=1 Tax=Streptomyces sp. NPDC096040 TaxID=3155541 RepID=UPI003327DB20
MTAGPDERTLHVIDGGGPETEQEAEARIREELHRRGVGPGGPASSPPPMPDHPPTIPAQPAADDQAGRTLTEWWRVRRSRPADQNQAEQDPPAKTAPARADNDRLPPWWDRRKPHLDEEPEPDDAEDAEDGEDGEDGEEEPEPKGKGRGPRPARRRVSKTSRPASDVGDEPDDGGEEVGEEQVLEGPRWSRPGLGRPPGLPAKRHNFITWWRQDVKPEHKWLMYHGTGLGAGVWAGVFSYGTRGAEFVTQQGLVDLEADVTLGLLGLVLVVDYRVRNLLPPLAWFVRAVSTSLVLGAAWNGTPLADLTN